MLAVVVFTAGISNGSWYLEVQILSRSYYCVQGFLISQARSDYTKRVSYKNLSKVAYPRATYSKWKWSLGLVSWTIQLEKCQLLLWTEFTASQSWEVQRYFSLWRRCCICLLQLNLTVTLTSYPSFCLLIIFVVFYCILRKMFYYR